MGISRVRGGFVPMLGKEPLVARPISSKSASKSAKGARASTSAVEFLHQDGTPVDPGLYKDVVFVNAEAAKDGGHAGDGSTTRRDARAADAGKTTPSTQWWTALDAAALSGVLFLDERRDVVVGDQRLSAADVDKMLTSLAPSRVAAPPVEVDAGFFHRTLSRWLGLDAGRTKGPRALPEPSWDYDFWKAVLEDDGVVDASQVRGAPTKGVVHRFTALVFRGERAEPERYAYWIALDDAGRIKRSGWFTAPPDLLGTSPRAFRDPSRPTPPSKPDAFDRLYDDT